MTPLVVLWVLSAGPEVDTLFPFRATVQQTSTSRPLVRLPLTREVLEKAQADMSDVRLLDAQRHLVPFTVRRHVEPGRRATEVGLRTLSVSRKARGAPHMPRSYAEEYVFELPTDPSGEPTLILKSAVTDFVREAKFEVLSASGAVLTTVRQPFFRLADANHEQVEATLPAFAPNASRLRVSFEGEGERYLEVSAALQLRSHVTESSTLSWPIAAVPEFVGKQTRFRMTPPPGFVPTQLIVQTTTPWFSRRVTVGRAGVPFASGFVVRRPGKPHVEVLSLRMPRTSGEPLEVTIDDQDSPPLQGLTLAWAIEQPELVFAAAAQAQQLVFGGARTLPAHFDVNLGAADDATDSTTAQLGTVEQNPRFTAQSVLADFRKPGAPFDASRSAYQARVAPWTAPEEVVVLGIGAPQAQTMTTDFRDVRLVDVQNRQWAYVLGTSIATGDLPLRGPTLRGNEAVYSCEPRGRVVGLTLKAPAGTRYFSRWAQLTWTEPGKRPVHVWDGNVTFNPSERGAPTQLHITFSELTARQGVLELRLDAVDDAPLEGLVAAFEVVVPTLKTVAPSGEYRVLWGDAHAKAPTYDLARAVEVLEASRSTAITAGAVEPNVGFLVPSVLERTGGATRWLFWSVLALAVLVLTGLGLRMARTST